MKEMCNHCGSELFVASYTKESLREHVIKQLELNDNVSHDEFLKNLVKDGFRLSDVQNCLTRLWHESIVKLTREKCELVK